MKDNYMYDNKYLRSVEIKKKGIYPQDPNPEGPDRLRDNRMNSS